MVVLYESIYLCLGWKSGLLEQRGEPIECALGRFECVRLLRANFLLTAVSSFLGRFWGEMGGFGEARLFFYCAEVCDGVI